MKLKDIEITQDMVNVRLPYIMAQAHADLAERPQWDDHRVELAILSDVKDLISMSEEELKNTDDPVYRMIGAVIDELRELPETQRYFSEKTAIDVGRKSLRALNLNTSGSEYINSNNKIESRQRNNSTLLEDIVTINTPKILATMTTLYKQQFVAQRRASEKERCFNDLLASQFQAKDKFSLVLSTTTSMETAKIWGDLSAPVVSDTHIDLLGSLFHAAVCFNGGPSLQPPATKGFIHNKTYWLGAQPYMTLDDKIIFDIKDHIKNHTLEANEGILNGHIDSISNQLSKSLKAAKAAFDAKLIDSTLFLTLSIQRDRNGLKTGAHYECFQITRDPNNPVRFILHEANSSLIDTVSEDVTKIESIQKNDTLKYVLAQAQGAGYEVSTVKAKTVYHQATDVGCGYCAMQTAIDSATTNRNISELDFHEGSSYGTMGLPTLETELRLSQMAMLFNSPNPDVQRKLIMGAASQDICLRGENEYQAPAPNGAMLEEYLPPAMRNSAAPIAVNAVKYPSITTPVTDNSTCLIFHNIKNSSNGSSLEPTSRAVQNSVDSPASKSESKPKWRWYHYIIWFFKLITGNPGWSPYPTRSANNQANPVVGRNSSTDTPGSTSSLIISPRNKSLIGDQQGSQEVNNPSLRDQACKK